jgi:hypothetical protein
MLLLAGVQMRQKETARKVKPLSKTLVVLRSIRPYPVEW